MKKLLMPIAMIMLCAMLTGCFASETPRSTPQATQSAAAQPPAFKTERLKESNPTLKVYDVKQKRIIEMPLEEYLEGVLAGEMPNDWPAEALKAQAILARTFVCKFIEEVPIRRRGHIHRHKGSTGIRRGRCERCDSPSGKRHSWRNHGV